MPCHALSGRDVESGARNVVAGMSGDEDGGNTWLLLGSRVLPLAALLLFLRGLSTFALSLTALPLFLREGNLGSCTLSLIALPFFLTVADPPGARLSQDETLDEGLFKRTPLGADDTLVPGVGIFELGRTLEIEDLTVTERLTESTVGGVFGEVDFMWIPAVFGSTDVDG